MNIYLIISLIANLLLMGFMLAFMYSLYMKDKQYDRDRRAMHVDATRTIEDAHKKAKQIIENAVDKARDTLLNTEYIKEDVMKDLERNLQDVSEATVKLLRDNALSFSKDYKVMLESIQVEHAKMLEEARAALKEIEQAKRNMQEDIAVQTKQILDEAHKSMEAETNKFDTEFRQLLETTKKEYMEKAETTLSALEKIPEQELTEFHEVLKKETLSAQQLLGKRVSDLFTEAEKEVAGYKEQRMREIETELSTVTGAVVEEVLGRKLTANDQEKLIMDALNHAKAEGVVGQASVVKPSV